MIIDADCHITNTGEGILCDDLITMMDDCGIDRAVTWLQPPYIRDITKLNEYVFESVQAYPDRLLGFGWADPNLGVEKAKDMVKVCTDDYDFYGVKLNGAQNDFYIDDPEISMPVIEEIAKSGKLLAFHIGADAYDKTHPFRVAKISEEFPELQILLVHMGGVGMPDDISDAAIEFALQHDNMTLIGSHVHHKAVLKAIRKIGAGRVCFGSDAPFQLMHVELAKYNALLKCELNEKEKEDVMGRNIARLFGL